MPLWNFQSLWYDEAQDSIFAFGGETSALASSPPDDFIWRFTPNGQGGGSWDANITSKSEIPWSLNITRPLGGAGLYTKEKGYLLGGYSSAKSSPQTAGLLDFVPTPGLITYDFSSGTWGNVTGTPIVSDTGAIEWPGIVEAPFGPNGVVVVIGGETSDLTSYTPGEKERWMSKITVYDPASGKFFQQTATGDQIPSPRNRFCVAGVGENRSDSYEM